MSSSSYSNGPDEDEYEEFDLVESADDDPDIDDDDDDDDDDDFDDDDFDESDADLDAGDDELEDAEPEDIDFVVAIYREDGAAVVTNLAAELANNLAELIKQLRRLPGDAGALGVVSLIDEIFILARVRGQRVQLLLSDASAALEYPIARDVVDFLSVDDPEDEDDAEPLGDLGMLSDLGIGAFDLGLLADTEDIPASQQLATLAERLKVGSEFRRATASAK